MLIKEMASQVLEHPEARPTRSSQVDTTSVPKAERLRIAREHSLKEAIDRFNHELLDDEERMLLLDRIKRLKKSLAS